MQTHQRFAVYVPKSVRSSRLVFDDWNPSLTLGIGSKILAPMAGFGRVRDADCVNTVVSSPMTDLAANV